MRRMNSKSTQIDVQLWTPNNFNHMNAPISQSLSRIEDEFRSAATQGGFDLTSFHDKWSSLFLDIEHAVQTGSLDKETMSLGNVVASRIATMSDCLLDFQT